MKEKKLYIKTVQECCNYLYSKTNQPVNYKTLITYIPLNHSYIFGQVLKSSQMPVKPYFMGVPGSFHIRHSSRIFSHLGIS